MLQNLSVMYSSRARENFRSYKKSLVITCIGFTIRETWAIAPNTSL